MTTPIPKPAVGSTGWDVSVDAVIDRVNELEGIEDDIAAKAAVAEPGNFPEPIGTSNTVGTDPAAARADHIHRLSTSDRALLDTVDTVLGTANEVNLPAGGQVNVGESPGTQPFTAEVATTGNAMFTGYVAGDTNARVLIDSNEISFGPGNASADTTLGRSGVGQMTLLGSLTVTGRVTTDGIVFPPVTLTDAATVALDASLGDYFRLAATASRTIGVPTNPTDGQAITIEHLASGGAWTLSLTTGSAGAFAFGSTITGLTATDSGERDLIRAIYNASLNRWMVVGYSKGF
jgi:hypothetical protein